MRKLTRGMAVILMLSLIVSAGLARSTHIAAADGAQSASHTAKTVYEGVDYAAVYDYDYYVAHHVDVRKLYGDKNDTQGALKYFVTYGMKKGHQAIADFNVRTYRNRHIELRETYGNDLPSYYLHYMRTEGAGQGGNAAVVPQPKKTPIMNSPTTTAQQMAAYYKAQKRAYPEFYQTTEAKTIEDFCQIYYAECVAEGVDPAVAFCQAMKETGFLQYGGDVKIDQYNFAGLGATGNGEPGNRFESVTLGVRAHIQHLKAYASTEPLKGECVDQRYTYVQKGCAPNVEDLEGRWATASGYGTDIVSMMNQLYQYEKTGAGS